ncbi:hypothetical protein EX30DRAFT_341650 [Ascodesmis nigricans]|uniref:Mid2 domain-containing protein n=1 Tax=Ascodesmis nigricans TaxID=341454 RepID=A0A4S2MV37_9PEZI|nr:hypothetical protein EX30DRAFT_341650 [Ascodesmis nigricans]
MARRSPVVLLTILLFALVAAANPVSDELERRGDALKIVLERRQDNNNGTNPQPPDTTTTPPPASTDDTTTNTPTTTPTTRTTTTPPPASSNDPTKDTSTTTPTETPATTSSVKSTLAPTTRSVVTIYTTKSGDTDVTMASTTLVTETPIIDVPAPTGKDGLSGDNDGGSSGGLDSKQKSIVIGVVVGVGGAILLGALAVVVFRVRKKRNNPLDADDYMNGRRDGSPLSSSRKEGSELGSSPFQATLDQYHRQPVNASSNF